MIYRYLLPILAALTFISAPALAGVAPRPCVAADYTDLPRLSAVSFKDGKVPDLSGLGKYQDSILIALFTPPELKYPYGSLDSYGVYVRVVVGVDGRVVCAALQSPEYGKTATMNYQRQAVLDSAGDWRFKPAMERGQLTAAVTSISIAEEELPRSHVAPPAGDPALMTLSLTSRFGSFKAYHVELHGDGTAIYASEDPDDPMGPQTYSLAPADVQGLIKAAGAADFWSLRDLYRDAPDYFSSSLQQYSLTLGGKTKSVTDYITGRSGTPSALSTFNARIQAVAKVSFWRYPTLETVAQLKRNGFDFTSARGGHLLQNFTGNLQVKDEVLSELMADGAPLDTWKFDRIAGTYETLLETALGADRTEMAKRLIASGALLKKGAVSAALVNRAFAKAVSSCDVAAVDLIAPFHPDMTYEDADDPSVRISVLWMLSDTYCETPVVMAQRLIDLGAEVDSKRSDGSTMLLYDPNDVDFVRFLLDHGADINATDEDRNTPLSSTYDQDVALLLLSRGADPRLGQTPELLRYGIKHRRWRDVKAWLEGHGFADVLVPEPGEE